MQSTEYDLELKKLPFTYEAALREDIGRLKDFVAGASESSVIGVGSGGSYTVASLLCNLHEAYTGRVSRPSTPLEIICNPTLASASPVFLISAEGGNPDIVEALRRAREHSARNVHVLTNRSVSKLLDCVREFADVYPHVHSLADKDGYLATNSLLFDAVLVARTYEELDSDVGHVPKSLDGLKLASGSIPSWVDSVGQFALAAVKAKNLIVIYSPLLRSVAADLESKISEAALLHCQLADLRSFAHGRHLWLAERESECAIIALTEPHLRGLWEKMRSLVPSGVATFEMEVSGSRPADLLAGLVAGMHLISLIAKNLGKDPGRPKVPPFGRSLYYADLPLLIPAPPVDGNEPVKSKYEVLGARWPLAARTGSMVRALSAFRKGIAGRTFRALVFDYDGTLCSSQSRDQPPDAEVIERLSTVLSAGVLIGIASGRGASIVRDLRKVILESLWKRVIVGLYNGGWIGSLESESSEQGSTSEFLSHVTRIVEQLKAYGVPIRTIRPTHPYQISIRLYDGVNAEEIWLVVADALKQAGLDVSRIVRSKHSVDVLAANVDKSHVVAHIVQSFRLDPYDILTIGDQGAWPGNDSSLLDHKYSLSVDVPSRRLDRAWKLSPGAKRDVGATLWYLDRMTVDAEIGALRCNFDEKNQ